MVVQIVLVNFYSKAQKWEYRSYIDSTEWRNFKKNIKEKVETLQNEVSLVTGSIMTTQQQNWLINQLAENYE